MSQETYILDEATIVGRVEEITKLSNNTVLKVYLGNLKINDNDPDNHVRVSIFVSSNNKSLERIAQQSVITARGKVSNSVSKNGSREVNMNATSIQPVGGVIKPQWGLFPMKSAPVFISGVFPSSNGDGYDVSAKYDKQAPSINNQGGSPKVEYKSDNRALKFKVKANSRAFKQINSAIKAFTGIELGNQVATQQQLDELKKCTGVLDIKWASVQTKNGGGKYNTYLNIYADSLMILNRIGDKQQNQSANYQNTNQSAPRQQSAPAPQSNIAHQEPDNNQSSYMAPEPPPITEDDMAQMAPLIEDELNKTPVYHGEPAQNIDTMGVQTQVNDVEADRSVNF